jgi:hypothetical protein
MSVSRKETLLVIKQRLLGLALALALLGTVGFAATSRAADDESDSFTVTASVNDVLLLDVSRDSVDFGNGINFLGQNAASGVSACTNSAQTAINGARYISPTVTTTVWSNRQYDVNRSISNVSSDINTQQTDLMNRTWIVQNVPVVDCSNALGGQKLSQIANPAEAFVNQPAANGAQHAEVFMFDVLINSPAGNFSMTVTYEAEPDI